MFFTATAKRIDLQLVWKTSLQDIVESPALLKSVSILTTDGTDGTSATHITLLVDGKIYFLRPEFLVRDLVNGKYGGKILGKRFLT